MRILLALLASSLALVAAGCGSSSSSSSSGASSAATTAASSPKDQLLAYFVALKPLRDQARTLTHQGADAINSLPGSPTKATVEAAVATLSTSADGLDALAPQVDAIAPPSGLEAAHAEYVAALHHAAALFRTLGADLAATDVKKFNADLSKVTAVSAQIAKWRAQVLAFAVANGVAPPTWVKSSGT